MSELKPCPFCGSMNLDYDVQGYITCNDCGCYGPDEKPYTNGTAILRWNTRAERTCKNKANDGKGFYCSLCGGVSVLTYDLEHFLVPSYCPDCGAKVVE